MIETRDAKTPLKLEVRVQQSAAELELLLDLVPKQHCRAEKAWNEYDEFKDNFKDIWGKQVG